MSELLRKKQMLQDFILKTRGEHIKQVFKQQIVLSSQQKNDSTAKSPTPETMARWKQRGKSATFKKSFKKLPLDEINRKLKDEAVDLRRQQSQAFDISRFEFLYRQAMMQERIKREKIKEAERIKDEDELKDAPFMPDLNRRSLLLAQNIPTLKDRTADLIEHDRLRNIDQRNSSYKKIARDLSTNKKVVNSKSTKKTILDPEDYGNFFNKNMEWFNHKMSKIDHLQSEKKKKEEQAFYNDCGRYQKRERGSSDAQDPLHSYFEHCKQKKIPHLDDDVGNVEKRLTFLDDDEGQEDRSQVSSDKDAEDVGASNIELPRSALQKRAIEEKENKSAVDNQSLEQQIIWEPHPSTKEKELVGALLNDLNDLRASMRLATGR